MRKNLINVEFKIKKLELERKKVLKKLGTHRSVAYRTLSTKINRLRNRETWLRSKKQYRNKKEYNEIISPNKFNTILKEYRAKYNKKVSEIKLVQRILSKHTKYLKY